ncbi:DUF6776 family protein [Noviherbaspirillum saxi]|uniref:Uncharacterized protein n=1 Tax=Noviherbaspirillum saxi TaxID=2320863 RepID=A0A3A3FTQ1_9BURK|nr:DUF6776 family protein [Noviherbaspirillum saxi]RJF99597.1 hypothetical protein D3871_14495 [Noviherbaspirillum saxi]
MLTSSPKLTIRRELPWPLRALFVIVVGVIGAAAMWTYDTGRGLPGFDPENARAQVAKYKERVEALTIERDQFSATANAAESQLNIERSAQKQLAAQLKIVESENVRLKEDLAFFESLLPNATGPQGITIRRLKIDQVAPNQVRYRLLIMQGGKGDQLFAGNLQLIVPILQSGKSVMMTFPDISPAEQEKFKLSFRYYQRVEGVLTLPEGATTKQVQARVLEKGQIRAQQSASL